MKEPCERARAAGGHLTKTEIDMMCKDLQDKEEQLQTLIATAQVEQLTLTLYPIPYILYPKP